MPIDVDQLLTAVSPEDHCGPDMSPEAVYLQLEKAAEGTPQQEVGSPEEGIKILPAVPPKWADVKSSALELMRQTKDLRVTMTLVAALLCTEGIPGLRDGLQLLQGLLDRHWDGFHPKLDPEDANDPLERVNIIASLAAPPGNFGDKLQFQARLRDAPLCSSKQLGIFGMRHVLVAKGELPLFDGAPDSALLAAAFEDTDIEELKRVADAATEAHDVATALDTWLTEKVGADQSANLAPFAVAIAQVRDEVLDQLAKRGYGSGAGEEAETPGTQEEGSVSGAIRSPQDVRLVLGKIIEYYEKTEPSSPVPLLLRRAQRLVSKNFVDIIQDLSPEAVKQIRSLGGLDGDEQ